MRYIPAPAKPTPAMVEAAYTIATAYGIPDHRARRVVGEIYEAMLPLSPEPPRGGLRPAWLIVRQVIADYIGEHGIAPTYREIAAAGKMTIGKAHRIVKVLERRGVLVTEGKHTRSILLLKYPGEEIKGKKSHVRPRRVLRRPVRDPIHRND